PTPALCPYTTLFRSQGAVGGRVVEVLDDHDPRPRDLLHVGGQGVRRVPLALAARPHRGGGRVPHHHAEVGEQAPDVVAHVADVAGAHVEQLDGVRQGRRVVLPQRIEHGRVERVGHRYASLDTESGAGTTAAGRLDANIWTDQIGRPDVRGLHRTDQPLTRPSPRDASPVAEVTRARLLGQFRARLHG